MYFSTRVADRRARRLRDWCSSQWLGQIGTALGFAVSAFLSSSSPDRVEGPITE